MSDNIEDLANQFAGFHDMMKQVLDELSNLKSWRGAVVESMGSLMSRTDVAAACLLRLENAPPPPPPPQPCSRGGTFDLNTALHPSTRPSAPSSERPGGHSASPHHRDAGDGVQGPPPRLAQGLPLEFTQRVRDVVTGERDSGFHSSPVPKMEFPKFDGTNPHLWRDHCEMYFDIYAVVPFLKTRFGSL